MDSLNLAQINRVLRVHNEVSKITVDWLDYVGQRKVIEISDHITVSGPEDLDFKKKESELYYRIQFAFSHVLDLVLELKEQSGVLLSYCKSLSSMMKALSEVNKAQMDSSLLDTYHNALRCIDDYVIVEGMADLQKQIIICKDSIFE